MKSLQNLSYKALFTILFFSLAGIVFFLRIGKPANKVSAAWWDESWKYRKSVSISNTSGNQSNVYITLTTDTSDTTRFQNDCGDIRFFSEVTNSLLNYYLVSGCGTTSTTIHINFPNLVNGNSTIYFYYGNSSAQNGFNSSDFSTAATNSTPSLNTEELPPDPPIAHWKLDEGSGNIIQDISINEIGVTFGGGSVSPTWLTGEDVCISNSCLAFNGTTNRINLPTINNIKAISMWLYITSGQTTSRYIIDARIGLASGYIYSGGFGSGWSKMYINGVDTTKTWANIPQNQWIHVYLEATSNFTDDINLMSRYSNTEYLSGKLDEIKLYSYARTPDQIRQDYLAQGRPKESPVNLGIQSSTAPSLKSSLVAYYKFDEGVGTTAYNSVSSNHGIFATGDSSPTWTNEGKSQKALSFNGNNEINTSSFSGLNETTWSFWVKPQTSNSQLMFRNLGASDYIAINTSGKAYRLRTFSGSGDILTNSGILPTNEWSHITMTYSNPGVKLYLNGKLENQNDTYTLGNLNSYFKIGRYSSSYDGLNGLIDEVKIYNRALTPEEVKQDYNQGSVVQFGSTNQTIGATTTSLEYCIPGDTSYCAPPVGEWDFEENTGTIAKDTSGNNNNGTFGTGLSAPTWDLGANNKGAGVKFINNASYIDNTSIIYGDSYTAEAWIKPTDLSIVESYGRTIISSSPTTKYPIWLLLRGNQIRAYSYSSSVSSYFIDSNYNDIQINNWYHVSLTATKNGQAKLYINGILDSTFTAGAQATAQKLTIADLRPGRNISFKGSIDQVKIYNYIRTPAQIAYDYNRGAPIGHWKLDECQGSVAHDSSGFNNHGNILIGQNGTQTTLGTCQTSTSAAWTNGAVGKVNSSLNFDGTDDYVSIPDSPSLTVNEITIAAWVKNNNSGDSFQRIVDKTYNQEYAFFLGPTGTIGVSLVTNTSSIDAWNLLPNAITDSNWHHVAFNWSATTKKITVYVDGVAKINTTLNGDRIADTNNPITIGDRVSLDRSFNGKIDDVRIYNYALTSEQIKQVYNGGSVNFR